MIHSLCDPIPGFANLRTFFFQCQYACTLEQNFMLVTLIVALTQCQFYIPGCRPETYVTPMHTCLIIKFYYLDAHS